MSTEPLPSSLTSFQPSKKEKEATLFLFNKADTDGLGVLTGEKAPPFFAHSGLAPALLGEVWQLSDPENSGFLTPERFGVACRLIGWAQSKPTDEIKEDWVGQAGPFPNFTGFTVPGHLIPPPPPTPTAPQTPASPPGGQPAPLATQTTGNGVNTVVSAEERARYGRLFAGSGAVNGLLDGDKARDIFIKSKLPFETLGQIWNLADTHSRGKLDVADFTVGMHLIQATMSGHLPSLPATLPPALYASASGLPPPGSPAASSGFRGGMPGSPLRQSSVPVVAARAISPPPPMPAYSPSRMMPGSPTPAPSAGASGGAPWAISAQEKAESDGYFATLDPTHQGYIEGEAAVGFFTQSGLPMDVLAKVWDLADIRGEGKLSREEFAVALRLIRDKVQGKEIPDSLDFAMTPPSLRPAASAAPQRDLLDWGDDDDAVPSAVPALQPQGTGASAATITRGQLSLSPQPTGVSLQGSIFPQNTGQAALSPQTTGMSNRGLTSPPVAAATSANFFDDNDDQDKKAELTAATAALSKEHATHTSTLSALQSEHKSAAASIEELTAQREELAKKVATANAAIAELQTKLSSTRASHESERGMFDELKTKHSDQSALLSRAKHELISAESDLSALRVERTEIEGEFLRDKEDVREMKRKMAQVALDTAAAKEALEKLKKEARQQKGLVAISKKQLAAAETDLDKAKTELAAAEHAIANAPVEATKAVEEESPFDHGPVVPAPVAAAYALPVSPPVFSPTASQTNLSLNPFARMYTPVASSEQIPAAKEAAATEAETSPGLPVAAAAAVGAGAVAAASAVGLGAAHALGFGSSESDKPKEDVDAAPSGETDPFGVPASQSMEVEADPFGVPLGATSGAEASGASAFEDSFASGFGSDNFAAAAPAAVAPSADFDDAFADMDDKPKVEGEDVPPPSDLAPEEAKAIAEPEAPAEGLIPEGVAPITPAEPLVGKEEVPAEPVPTPAVPAADLGEEEDSSDDEPEIEDAVATRHQPKSLAASTSDSGESFVHVSSAPETEAENKFPALDAIAEPAAVAAPAVAVDEAPKSVHSEEDAFEDANAEPEVPAVAAPIPSPVGSEVTATGRRAAPPPPVRSGLSSASVPTVGAPADETVATMPAQDDFESSFADLAPAIDTGAAPSPKASTMPAADDFESSFADLAPAQATGAGAEDASFADDFEGFDNEEDSFSFKPTFDAPTAAGPEAGAGAAFDSSFADFDSAFEPAPTSAGAEGPAAVSSTGFDDAFGAATTGSPTGLGVEPQGGAGSVTPGLDDDVDGVKQITSMGFSRTQAIEALEKYNYDVGRALNSMLG